MLKNLLDWLSNLPSNPAFPFVVGAVVGGVFAILGGYLGSRVLVRDERRRQRRELIAAIAITRSEFARNLASIAAKLQASDVPVQANLELFDSSFRSVAPILANQLPTPLFHWLSAVNDQVSRMEQMTGHAALSKGEIESLKDLRARIMGVNKLLRRYLREKLNVTGPTFPDTSMGSAEEIEKTLEATLFLLPPKWHFWRRKGSTA